MQRILLGPGLVYPEKKSLIVESERLASEIASENTNNEKLEAEVKLEEEDLIKLISEMASTIQKAIHCDNLELAKTLRADLDKNDEITKEIELLEKDKSEADKKNQECHDVLLT